MRKLIVIVFVLAFTAQASASYCPLQDKCPLHQAVVNNNLVMVTLLISEGADINNRDWMYARSPLMLAAERGYTEIAAALVDAGAKLELRSRSRSTALHYAAYYYHAETFHYLLLKGANVQAVNRRYEMPYGLACTNGWHDILGPEYPCK